MSRTIILRRTAHGFGPFDEYAAAQIEEFPIGAEFIAKVDRLSSTGKTEREGLRGRWWGVMQLIAENADSPLYDEKRKASNYTLLRLGWVRPRYRLGGGVDLVPYSLADSAMDDDELQVLTEKAAAFWTGELTYDPFIAWEAEQDAKNASKRRR